MADRIISTVDELEELSSDTLLAVFDNSGVLIFREDGIYLIGGLHVHWYSYDEGLYLFGPLRVIWSKEDYNG